MSTSGIPKTIWFLWLQGLDQAPVVVQKCYESWLKHNPDWNIVLLNEDTIQEYIPLNPRQITHQALSDILRINLLAKYGGIWIDATCFCVKPLDEWIYNYLNSGFFVFERPAPDRMISSWFIASSATNHITQTYKAAVNEYWETNPDLRFFEDSEWSALMKKTEGLDTKMWFDIFVTRVLKVYPYFWFHYLFEKIYLQDETVRKIWDSTPKISADLPHRVLFSGLVNPLSEDIKEEIDNRKFPIYKLSWKFDPAEYKEGTILYYLLNRRD